MPNIVIKESDETIASLEGTGTDVVYVPGFAATNCNVYISETSGKYPTDALPGSVAGEKDTYNTVLTSTHSYPSFACNIADKKMWKCTAVTPGGDPEYTWTEQATYTAPTPENVPTLCVTKKEFEDAFGKLPYQWVVEYVNGSKEESSSLESRMKYPGTNANPAWEANAFQSNENFAYNDGDYEKSFMYAYELVANGLPVIYDNIVERVEVGDTTFERKVPPTVTYLYQHLSDQLNELTDTGEYTVKYITSGAYPTFEYTGAISYTKEVSDTISTYDFKGNAGTSYIIPTPNCSGTEGGVEIGGPQRAVITFTYETIEEGETVIVTNSIEVNKGTIYTQTSDTGFGGVNNTIECVADGVKVTYANPTVEPVWDFNSATVVATAQVSVPDNPTDLTAKMVAVATQRGDAVAIIDHTNNPARALTGTSSVYFSISQVQEHRYDASEFATMFTPWASYTLVNQAAIVPAVQMMPASFAFTSALARSVKTNVNWLAIAGVSRGLVPNIRSLNTIQRLSNTIANIYQPREGIAINAITNIKPYGLTIWGNRTLRNNENNLKATSLLNIRNLVSEVKKVAYTTAKSLMFEQNTEVLWDSFKTGIVPLLDQMTSGQGLTGYKIIRGATTERAKVVAEIRLYPIDAVEDFEITVKISDENVSVD